MMFGHFFYFAVIPAAEETHHHGISSNSATFACSFQYVWSGFAHALGCFPVHSLLFPGFAFTPCQILSISISINDITLQEQGFLNVHTPLITSLDCEGAGELFCMH
jgi:hypothetical protein